MKFNFMLKVGVLGAGHLGKIHLRLLQQSSQYELVGFYDENQENGAKIEAEFGYKQFDTIARLLHAVDVVDIVTPTLSHYKCAKVAIKSGKHVFIEKPIATTVEEAEERNPPVRVESPVTPSVEERVAAPAIWMVDEDVIGPEELREPETKRELAKVEEAEAKRQKESDERWERYRREEDARNVAKAEGHKAKRSVRTKTYCPRAWRVANSQ